MYVRHPERWEVVHVDAEAVGGAAELCFEHRVDGVAQLLEGRRVVAREVPHRADRRIAQQRQRVQRRGVLGNLLVGKGMQG